MRFKEITKQWMAGLCCCALVMLLSSHPIVAQDDFGGSNEFGDDFGGGSMGAPVAGPQSIDLSDELQELRKISGLESESAADQPAEASPPAEATYLMSPAMQALQTRLDVKTSVAFVDTPLTTIRDWLKQRLEFNVVVDENAIEEEGLSLQDELSFTADGISYRTVIQRMLAELHLTYTLSDETLQITTDEVREETLTTRIYPIWDLVQDGRGANYDTVIGLITQLVTPNSWDDVGGPGSIAPLKGTLTVSNTLETHEEITSLLSSIRRFDNLNQQSIKVRGLQGAESHAKIVAVLNQKVHFEFQDSSLDDVIAYVKQVAGVPVLIDRHALHEEGIDSATETVSISLAGVSLQSALRLTLKPLQLTHVIDNEVLSITSRPKAEETLLTKLYQCWPLIDAEESNAQGTQAELDLLENLISSTVAPDSWDEVGGPGCITVFPQRGILAISNTSVVHDEIEPLIQKLVRATSSTNAPPRVQLQDPSETIVKVYQLSAEFVGMEESKEQQAQLLQVVKGLLEMTGNGLDGKDTNYAIQPLGSQLVVTHRREVHGPLSRILVKLNAIN